MNPFDYYNKDKDKHYITSKNIPFINIFLLFIYLLLYFIN